MTDTDEYLIEMAAKAAQLPESGWMGPAFMYVKDNTFTDWNPLTDDGDALRLAVRLCISVRTGPCEASANSIDGALRGFFPKEDTIKQDHMHAVRRVIVLAAADIGRQMP